MEITTRPRSRRAQRWATGAAVLAAVLGLCLLVPASLGLTQHVVTDHAMGGTLSRGALVFERPVRSAADLRPGDVITFPLPDAVAAPMTTRRVVAVDATSVTTRGDAHGTDDPWALDVAGVQPMRTVFAVPLAGYPQILVPWLTWAVLATVLGASALLSLLVARRRAGQVDLTLLHPVDRTAPVA